MKTLVAEETERQGPHKTQLTAVLVAALVGAQQPLQHLELQILAVEAVPLKISTRPMPLVLAAQV
jgi:hypothetical protein